MSHGRAARLLVVSGPGGVGKGTVVAALVTARDDLAVSLSATTRPMRPGEEDGVHYRFVSQQRFQDMIDNDEFLEWADFNDHRYGTPWSSIDHPPHGATTVVLEIDVQGAVQVRQRRPDALLTFLAPPSWEVLEARLRGRATDNDATIARRLEIGRWELDQSDAFDHVIVNDRVGEAVSALGRILDTTIAAGVDGGMPPHA